MTAPFDFQALAARASADNPDAALFDAIERDKTRNHRFNRAMAACRGKPLLALRAQLAAEWVEDLNRLAATRPATLEGLLAKLRHVLGKTGSTGIYAEHHAALTDAIEWLDPPKPKRGSAGRKHVGRRSGGAVVKGR